MATTKKYTRTTERLLLACVTAIIAALCMVWFFNVRANLETAEKGYQQGTVINLAAGAHEDTLKKILTKGGYFTDSRYVQFIAANIIQKLKENKTLPNLGALNKAGCMLNAQAFLQSGSEAGELRFLNSLAHLGMDADLYRQEQKNPTAYASAVAVQKQNTDLTISGKISYDLAIKHPPSQAGILIKLTELFPEGYSDTAQNNASAAPAVFYARTDDKGQYTFSNIKKNGNYSVIAIKPGYEFGRFKGQAAISSSLQLHFTAKPHLLKIVDATEYRQIKNDKVCTVRTPVQLLREFVGAMLLFVCSFWLFHIVLSAKQYDSDPFILPLLMFIIGVGVVTLYSIQDPLRDEIYGTGMAVSAAGVVLFFSIAALLVKKDGINRFYHSSWFDPVTTRFSFFNPLKAPRGYTWLLLSIGLMLLLLLLGTGPEGSGVKVNLLGFQVSELSKFLMIVFFAAYFTANAAYFRSIADNRWLTKNNRLMIALFLLLLSVYAALGDLGPAIVLCLTFLFFYAFAKEEFFQMITAGAVFGILLFIASKISERIDYNILPIVAATACIGSLLYAYYKKKYETIFFIILLMASFILLATLPFDFTKRLADRNSMFGNIWENNFIGGDQLAQGVWSLNAGGFLGQGLGKGLSTTMPAYHTDMILQSMGEEIGMVGLIAILLAFGLLFYRCILAARKTGKPFLFYLMSGIAIATLLQFIIIAAGTLGLMPLTGISVPFLSKGNAGIIVTLFAFMIVILLSHQKGDALEMEYIKKHFDAVNASVILTFFAVLFVFVGSLLWYQFRSNTYIVKPALVLNRQGAWYYSYNPRIALLIREVKPGNIYDKNGILLATSDKNTFSTLKDKLIKTGAGAALYQEQLSRNQKRYYPYGANLLFWLGDYNKEIAKEENNGYAAEYRHYTMLRGFEVPYTTVQKTSDRYRESRFLPPTEKETELMLYDYSTLAPLLKAGSNSSWIQAQQSKPKDIQLSVDVLLQQKISTVIQQSVASKNFRTAVMAINATTGDVLASATNPPPSYKDLKLISNIEPQEYRSIFKQLFDDKIVVDQDLGITYNSRPGSTVKIIDAYAALNQYGLNAAQFSYFVYPQEVIHTGEPVNEEVDMHKAIVRSSNVYFIKLINEKKLQQSLFDVYDALGININNRGGFHFQRPRAYNSANWFQQWNTFVSKGKNIYYNKRLQGSKRRFESNYSHIAWGQGELMATPLQLAKMSGAIASKGQLQPSRFLLKSWSSKVVSQPAQQLSKQAGMDALLASFMKEQSATVAAATGLDVRGKTGSPERDKISKQGNSYVRKRVTDAWYTFYVYSPKIAAPIAFAIRIEEIGNSEYAKNLAKELLNNLKASGYF